jgi:hypothetical protein
LDATADDAMKFARRAAAEEGILAGISSGATLWAATELAKSNTTLQWGIILTIFTPICVGFFIFGYYGLKGEYDQLPTSSKDLE